MTSQNESNKKRENKEVAKLTPEEEAVLRMETLHSNIELKITHSSPDRKTEGKCDLNPDDYIEAEMGYELMEGEDACNETEKE